MANGSYIALSAAVAAQKQLDVVANNLANIDTTGFKQQRMQFTHVLARAGNNLTQEEKGYVDVNGTFLSLDQGAITSTGNPLDIALHGDGFLVVEGQGSPPLLTRNGSLAISQEGHLVDSLGRKVMMDTPNQEVVLTNSAKVTINEQGQVFQDNQMVGTLRLVRCDPGTLKPQGAATFSSDPDTWQAANTGVRVLSGHLESSNVNAISNLTKLIELNRGYQSTQRVLDRYTKMDKRAIDSMG